MSLNVYLHFNGNCREVFEFYRSVFGGDFTIFETFQGMPEDMAVPDEEKDNVMHVSYDIGGTTLMGSDVPSNFSPPVTHGNNFSISYTAESREQTDEIFSKISAGGEVSMPLDDMFWGSYFGGGTDKYGINWMISYDAPQASS